MSRTDALDRLCRLYGILPSYEDIWGHTHTPSRDVRRKLLAAMGLPVASDAEVEAALAQTLHAAWQRLLPEVRVIRGDAPADVTVTLAEEAREARWNWVLIEENGQRHEGEFIPRELEELERRQFEGATRVRHRLPLPDLPPGYHRLQLQAGHGQGEPAGMLLIVAPSRCYMPPELAAGGRLWGLNVQLYTVRSERNWGMGDFTDLSRLLEFAAESGASLLSINPVHALFPHNPTHASPYSPSSRRFLNPLYIDVEAVPGLEQSEGAFQRIHSNDFQARLRALRATETVDYAGVAAAKREILELLYREFRRHHLREETEEGRDFRRFQAERGAPLFRQSLCEALQEHLHARDSSLWGWPVWPPEYRDPEGDAVKAFAREHLERLEFFQYLQWEASRQLERVKARAEQLDMSIGLCTDLAVGVDVGGAATWSDQALFALPARIGSPPDDFNLKGQDWGLPPQIPARLKERAYAPFIETLRYNMQSAGAVRIDHVMALMRLYWIPPGGSPGDGTYVAYPFEDLMGIVALESQRNRCLVIGEDLGTVADELRQALRPLGVLSYRLEYFERDEQGRFIPPADYPQQALAAVTTHDLPTLAGYWKGRDLSLRKEQGLFPDQSQRDAQIVERAESRAQLLLALEREGLLPEGMSADPVRVPEMTPALVRAIHCYLARSPACIVTAQVDDLLLQMDQVNLPGSTDQYPNWQKKLPLNLEQWSDDPDIAAFTAAMRRARSLQQAVAEIESAEQTARMAIIPRATYRLQLNRDFDFNQATGLIPYLHELGISHCYASPLLQARPGSPHGYDIVAHDKLNPELGGQAEFQHLVQALKQRDMGLIMDVVINHMGVMGSDNPWWLDVLENGRASPFATFFDIDWYPLKDELRGKVLLPVLGDHYGNTLEKGDLKLAFDPLEGSFCLFYFEHRFPIDPREYPRILGHALPQLEERLDPKDPALLEFESLITAFGNLPSRYAFSPENIAERARDKALHKQHLAELHAANGDIAHYIDEVVRIFNGTEEKPADWMLMHELIDAQAYRPAYWRVAADEINYRRFFDINELAALRIEDPAVFDATHALLLELVASGKVEGLRIDHPDGLFDPQQYIQRLQQAMEKSRPGLGAKSPYLILEKILAAHEHLRQDWDVHGTTGYDFANLCNHLFLDGPAAEALRAIHEKHTGQAPSPGQGLYECKKLIMRVGLASELNVLATALSRIAESDPHTRDFTLIALRRALEEVIASFPVYRTYIRDGQASAEDARYIEWAVSVAKKRSRAADTSVFDFLREVLLTSIAAGKPDNYRALILGFAMKFQQYTAPVMAKGMEDTFFYRHNRLISLNEVGGDPERFGLSVAAFHHANQERLRDWPHSLLAGTTHDSKLSEDVRARINVLSELPREWDKKVRRWRKLNQHKKAHVDDCPAPCANDEYRLYQVLIGAWPLEAMNGRERDTFSERITQYMLKAVREAKLHSSWVNPDQDYEAAVKRFVHLLLKPADQQHFLDDFLPFQHRVARLGMLNSLAQTLLRLTVPGVPDIYQGDEVWNFCLVDPDNRRPVDFDCRRALLQRLKALSEDADERCEQLHRVLEKPEDGSPKLYLIHTLLTFRQQHAELFRRGEYIPLETAGPAAENLCVFARKHDGQIGISVVPRLCAELPLQADALLFSREAWTDTRIILPHSLAGIPFRNVLSGAPVKRQHDEQGDWLSPGEVLRHFPVALLGSGEE